MQLSAFPEGTEEMQIWKRSVVCCWAVALLRQLCRKAGPSCPEKEAEDCDVTWTASNAALALYSQLEFTVNLLHQACIVCTLTFWSGFNLEPTGCLSNIVQQKQVEGDSCALKLHSYGNMKETRSKLAMRRYCCRSGKKSRRDLEVKMCVWTNSVTVVFVCFLFCLVFFSS